MHACRMIMPPLSHNTKYHTQAYHIAIVTAQLLVEDILLQYISCVEVVYGSISFIVLFEIVFVRLLTWTSVPHRIHPYARQYNLQVIKILKCTTSSMHDLYLKHGFISLKKAAFINSKSMSNKLQIKMMHMNGATL